MPIVVQFLLIRNHHRVGTVRNDGIVVRKAPTGIFRESGFAINLLSKSRPGVYIFPFKHQTMAAIFLIFLIITGIVIACRQFSRNCDIIQWEYLILNRVSTQCTRIKFDFDIVILIRIRVTCFHRYSSFIFDKYILYRLGW